MSAFGVGADARIRTGNRPITSLSKSVHQGPWTHVMCRAVGTFASPLVGVAPAPVTPP